MTRYLFILGRNPLLSVEEIKSFCSRTGNKILDSSLKGNGFLADLEKTLEAGTSDSLGGVISIGIVLGPIKDIDRKEIYFSEKNNFSYVLWDFSEKTDEVSEYLKSRFRKEKLKASEKKTKEIMKMQDESYGHNFRSKLVDEEYFVFENYFGRIVDKCNYSGIEKRDMEKPFRRESLSISPRIAKIMINLSEVPEGGRIVDAFCGIGTILQEAILQKINAIGIDKDGNAIKGCRKNMEWFGFSEKDYNLIEGNSSGVKIKICDAMISEPDFGETLKRIPTKEKAEAMIKKYEDLMIKVLNNMKKYVENRMVFTSPLIRIGKKRVGADFVKIEKMTGLKIVNGFPIGDFREGQIVGREIVVMKKQ